MSCHFVASHVARHLPNNKTKVDDFLEGGTKEGGHEEMHDYNYRSLG